MPGLTMTATVAANVPAADARDDEAASPDAGDAGPGGRRECRGLPRLRPGGLHHRHHDSDRRGLRRARARPTPTSRRCGRPRPAPRRRPPAEKFRQALGARAKPTLEAATTSALLGEIIAADAVWHGAAGSGQEAATAGTSCRTAGTRWRRRQAPPDRGRRRLRRRHARHRRGRGFGGDGRDHDPAGEHLPPERAGSRRPRSGAFPPTAPSRRRSNAGAAVAEHPQRRAVPRRRGGARAEHVRAGGPGHHRAVPPRRRPVDQPVGQRPDQPRRGHRSSSRRSSR